MPRMMSDIGNKITHTFQITNDGPWHVENMDVLIDWPYQLASSKDHEMDENRKPIGKWLLYLTEAPEISPKHAGQCYINPRRINALGLRRDANIGRAIHSRSTLFPHENAKSAEAFTTKTHTSRSRTKSISTSVTRHQYSTSGTYSSFSKSITSLHSGNELSKKHQQRMKRRKRKRKEAREKRSLEGAHLASHTNNDISYQNYHHGSDDSTSTRSDISSREYSSDDVIYSDKTGGVGWTATSPHTSSYNSFSALDYSRAVMLDCSGDKIKCHIFDCRLNGLRANESVVIRLRSRLWNSTLLHEFGSKAELVVIQTRARLGLPEALDIHQSVVDNDVTVASLVGIPRQTEGTAGIEAVPLWIILLSVAIGLVVVICIAATLWKLGFFRRNRHPDDVMISAKIMHSNNGGGVAQYHDREDEYMS